MLCVCFILSRIGTIRTHRHTETHTKRKERKEEKKPQ